MKLVILIPAYNEEESIAKVLSSIPLSFVGIDKVVKLVVDDGSKDNTVTLAKEAGATVISHPQNKGVGVAFNTGLVQALELDADIMVNIDADGQFSTTDIPQLIAPILSGEADFVTGDRFTTNNGRLERPEAMSKLKYWGNLRMSKLISFLTNTRFNDVSCGFRAYSKEAMLRLNLTRSFTYTQETFLDLANKDVQIKSVPVKVTYFKNRKSRVAGSILNYFYHTVNIIIRAYRDYRPLRFFIWMGLIPFIIGLGFSLFTLSHYLNTGSITPYKAYGLIGIYLFTMGIVFWIIGLLADMFVRIRIYQEQLLYYEKKNRYEKKKV